MPSAVNGGVVGARNRGMVEAQGRYIAALDQDDLCHPERFARQIAYLDAHPGTVLLGTAAGVLQDGALLPSSHAPLSRPVLIEWLLRIENPLVWSSVMIRADAARRLDPFNRPDLLYAEDFDLYHRIARLGDLARLDEELLTYRRHVGGASQRYVDAMTVSASQVLAREYAALFGEEAAEVAGLIVRHVMRGLPVPDRETFERLGDTLVRLQEDFIATRQPDADSLGLIRWETARRWARIAPHRLARRFARTRRRDDGSARSSRPRLCRDRGACPVAARRRRAIDAAAVYAAGGRLGKALLSSPSGEDGVALPVGRLRQLFVRQQLGIHLRLHRRRIACAPDRAGREDRIDPGQDLRR